MRLKALVSTLLLVPAAVLTVAADVPDDCTADDRGTPENTADDFVFCPTTVYLGGCEQAEAGKVYDPVTRGSVPLVDEAPTESFTAGAGCGTPEIPFFLGVQQETPFDFNTSGFSEQVFNPRSATVTLHDIYAARSRQNGAPITLSVRFTVDGFSPSGTETVQNTTGDDFETPATIDIPVPPVKSATGVSESFTFTIANIDAVAPDGFFAPGLGRDFRNVILTVGFDGLTEAHTIVWGAEEIDSKIEFNVPEAGPTYDAALGRVRPAKK